ncbi:hypothetical protein OAM01_01115 [bacterium]|nr:hypothetical protein [bacterium]
MSLALVGLLTIANAQERIETSKAKEYAQLTRQNPELLKTAPFHFEADLDQPVGLSNNDFGGLIIPRARLSEGTKADVGSEPVAIGEIWLYNLTLEEDGWAVSENNLDIVSINTEEGSVKIPRCVLGVKKRDGKSPVLMLFGKTQNPLVTVPLTKIQKKQSNPLDMSASENGKVTLSILGKYQATFNVAELYL